MTVLCTRCKYIQHAPVRNPWPLCRSRAPLSFQRGDGYPSLIRRMDPRLRGGDKKGVIPAEAETHASNQEWTPAFAGVTE